MRFGRCSRFNHKFRKERVVRRWMDQMNDEYVDRCHYHSCCLGILKERKPSRKGEMEREREGGGRGEGRQTDKNRQKVRKQRGE